MYVWGYRVGASNLFSCVWGWGKLQPRSVKSICQDKVLTMFWGFELLHVGSLICIIVSFHHLLHVGNFLIIFCIFPVRKGRCEKAIKKLTTLKELPIWLQSVWGGGQKKSIYPVLWTAHTSHSLNVWAVEKLLKAPAILQSLNLWNLILDVFKISQSFWTHQSHCLCLVLHDCSKSLLWGIFRHVGNTPQFVLFFLPFWT